MAIAVDRNWPMVQTTFFLLETLVLLMKMHSYIMTNREYDKQFVANNQQRVKPEGNEPSAEQGESITRKVQYPDNVTLKNYVFFLVVPTLVYEMSYPRLPKMRYAYFVEKFSSFVGLWAVMHVLADTYILPVLEQSPSMTQLEAISSLIIPFTVGYMIVFYMVFDVACNGFAELTRFADREFYSDWWNSKTFDEFARKWNKPVHEFLLRHVYLESINNYKMSQTNATLLTFLFSSIVHEFFMTFALRIFRPWLFLFQMSQLPLIYLFRVPWLKNNRFNNHFFWFGMILGPPLISLLYAREFYIAYP
jgi:sterol O-acyltransferase